VIGERAGSEGAAVGVGDLEGDLEGVLEGDLEGDLAGDASGDGGEGGEGEPIDGSAADTAGVAGGGVGGGFGFASLLGTALRWLLLVNALLGLSYAVMKCLRGCGRWLVRGVALARPDAKLSREGRWNFTYVAALVADPRDVNSYVWGFGGVQMPRMLPGHEDEKARGRGGNELMALGVCAFLAAVALYVLLVSHVARWGLQTGFLLSQWALYLMLVAGAVAFGNALGTRLFEACAPCCEPSESLGSRGAPPTEPAAEGHRDAKSPAAAPAALVDLGADTLRELRELREKPFPTAAHPPEGGPGLLQAGAATVPPLVAEPKPQRGAPKGATAASKSRIVPMVKAGRAKPKGAGAMV